MAENNWVLNQTIPLSLAQEFQPAEQPWVTTTYWGFPLYSFNLPQVGSAVIYNNRTLMGVGS